MMGSPVILLWSVCEIADWLLCEAAKKWSVCEAASVTQQLGLQLAAIIDYNIDCEFGFNLRPAAKSCELFWLPCPKRSALPNPNVINPILWVMMGVNKSYRCLRVTRLRLF